MKKKTGQKRLVLSRELLRKINGSGKVPRKDYSAPGGSLPVGTSSACSV